MMMSYNKSDKRNDFMLNALFIFLILMTGHVSASGYLNDDAH